MEKLDMHFEIEKKYYVDYLLNKIQSINQSMDTTKVNHNMLMHKRRERVNREVWFVTDN